MQIRRFVCCNPSNGSNHCGKVHDDIRDAIACRLALQVTLDLTDEVNWWRACVVGHLDERGQLLFAPSTQQELYELEHAHLMRLGVGLMADSDDEIAPLLQKQLDAIRGDIARNPSVALPAPRARRSTRTARKAA